jgi:DNA-binding MarR family transcriptional regulator
MWRMTTIAADRATEDPARAQRTRQYPDPRLRPWVAFLRTHAALTRRLESELEDGAGLSLADYDALFQLASSERRALRMNELADRLLLTRSGVSRLVDRLVEDGYVERSRCATDGRGAYAVLTERGETRLREAAPTHLAGIERHFLAHLPAEDAAAFTRALETILADLDPAGEPTSEV